MKQTKMKRSEERKRNKSPLERSAIFAQWNPATIEEMERKKKFSCHTH